MKKARKVFTILRELWLFRFSINGKIEKSSQKSFEKKCGLLQKLLEALVKGKIALQVSFTYTNEISYQSLLLSSRSRFSTKSLIWFGKSVNRDPFKITLLWIPDIKKPLCSQMFA